MNLIVTEKPSVARDLAKALGTFTKKDGALHSDEYVITWCIGHVVELAPPEHYNKEWKKWSFNQLPMLPEPFKLIPSKRTRARWAFLRRYFQSDDFDSVVNACDAGREGELIFRYVYDLANSQLPIQRLWLSSMTDSAITTAFQNLKSGTDFDHLYDAARSRSEADWLIGLNATRAMTLAAQATGNREGVKSIGRVQTPTLALLVQREKAIRNHKPAPFYNVYSTFHQKGSTWEAELVTDTPKNRLDDKSRVDSIIAELKNIRHGEVFEVEAKQKNVQPPLLYDLATLQREANKRHNLTAKQTLDAAQSLYEKKFISYPRTDSAYLTPDMAHVMSLALKAMLADPWDDSSLENSKTNPDIADFAQRVLDNPAEYPLGQHIFNAEKVTDHHAILPTEIQITPTIAATLNKRELLVLELVQRRFLAQYYGTARFSLSRIMTRAGEHVFEAKGTRLDDRGWQLVDPPHTSKKDQLLPSVSEGKADLKSQRLHSGKTQPPSRYTEATLLSAMENAGKSLDESELRKAMKEAGLGTAATRASIIEVLLRRNYVERSKKHLLSTKNGEQLIDSLPEKGLKSPRLTARWEAALKRIETGELGRSEFMTKVRKLTSTIVGNIRDAELHFSTPDSPGSCPLCQTPVVDIGKLYTCQTGRDCNFLIFKKIAKKSISSHVVKSLLEGDIVGPLNGFKSKQGKSFSARLTLDETGRVTFVFDELPQTSS